MYIETYQNFLSNFCFGCLFLSMLFYLLNFVFLSLKIFHKLGWFTSLLANIVLFVILSERWISSGYFPLSNLYESLLFLSWTLLFIQLILEFKTSSKIIGILITPIVLLINGFSNLSLPLEMQKASPLVPALQSNWLMMHVSLMMLSYATLITGSLFSILFLLLSLKKENFFLKDLNQNSNLNKNTELLNTNLQTSLISTSKFLKNIDNLSYRTISLGFPFLTLGIISGAVWANEAWGSYWSWDPKETWALITWLIFAAYLHARIIKKWKSIQSSILASIGFIIVWICYLGVNFLGQGLHSYGWMI
jgi:cytochrome c-type biogenesis protein CcsB